MCYSLLLIKTPEDWATVARAVIALTRNCAADVRYVASVEELTDDGTIVDVVVMQLYGDADYALEIYWKGMASLADDTVGMYLAVALSSTVIVADEDLSPWAWLRMLPDGVIEKIVLDIEQLDVHSIVSYKVA